MDIKTLQEQVKALRDAQGWHDMSAEQTVAFLTSEMGEVAREVLKLSGAYGPVDISAVKQELGMEIYDVMWNLCDLANMLDIDLEAAFARKVEINRNRKW